MTEPTAYFNENDPFAAAWLRELIKAGHIAKGEVDERSIEDVKPDELRAFTQCHFFAGIGVWSYALRQAGWPDDRAVWTGSCPCQPFSAAGKRGGTSDERHLWPALYHLIGECSPSTFFGEQVASKDGLAWFQSVYADLENKKYAIGVSDLCAAGFGAPHIRQRLYFVADSQAARPSHRRSRAILSESSSGSGEGLGLADPNGGNSSAEGLQRSGQYGQFEEDGRAGRLVLSDGERRQSGRTTAEAVGHGDSAIAASGNGDMGNPDNSGSQGRIVGRHCPDQLSSGTPGLVNGVWREADWIYCRDEKYRPVEAGTFPLAHGIANRVGKLRGYGNAIVAPVATAFIESFLEVERESA